MPNPLTLSTMQVDTSVSPAYDRIPTSILLDGLLQAFFLGFIFGQAVRYWSDYGDDSWRKRLFVAIVILLSTIQAILEALKLWKVAIQHEEWSASLFIWMDVPVTGAISLMCECFFIRRCWKMTDRRRWVLYPMLFLVAFVVVSITILTINICVTFTVYSHVPPTQFLVVSALVSFSSWVFGEFVLDFTVASIMVVTLWRSKTGIEHVDRVVRRIMRITCESALLPCLSLMASVSIYHAESRGKDNLVLFFVMLTGKLYAFVLLRTLNARGNLRQRFKSHDLGRVSLGAGWQWQTDKAVTTCSTLQEPVGAFTHPFDGGNRASVSSTTRMLEHIAPHESVPSVIAQDIELSLPFVDPRERGVFIRKDSQ